ncbi:hypothetical protein CEXT_482281 [Caerostris extrusa]|uniref:Uncharacterized protein n=1 Tax=Caerostris extrusa TaxID=172846 RepID=A0AAV4XUF8_CAEEX|nr:hypothetical protein CEXT_482281 [Caerostris extrusa]
MSSCFVQTTMTQSPEHQRCRLPSLTTIADHYSPKPIIDEIFNLTHSDDVLSTTGPDLCPVCYRSKQFSMGFLHLTLT